MTDNSGIDALNQLSRRTIAIMQDEGLDRLVAWREAIRQNPRLARLAGRSADAGPRALSRAREPRALSEPEKLEKVDALAARYRRLGLSPAGAYQRALEAHPELVMG